MRQELGQTIYIICLRTYTHMYVEIYIYIYTIAVTLWVTLVAPLYICIDTEVEWIVKILF